MHSHGQQVLAARQHIEVCFYVKKISYYFHDIQNVAIVCM